MFGKRKNFRNKRPGTLKRLEDMLEQAVNGTFEESDYDESRLSRLEVRWKGFLASSAASQRKILEEQERTKTLISDISHQTKTPLANLLLYSQLLLEMETRPELTDIVNNIKRQSEKLDFLISSLIKVSRLESQVFVLRPQSQPVAPMLEAVVSSAREEAERKGITIEWEAGEETACFDRKWTQEALGNLLDNGIKYSPSGGTVEVRTKAYEMFTAVLVKDSGIGIREEEQGRIFERFYRSGEVSEKEGVGLGLYLAREIAARQNGYIKVKSKHGEGSTFFFYMSNQERPDAV